MYIHRHLPYLSAICLTLAAAASAACGGSVAVAASDGGAADSEVASDASSGSGDAIDAATPDSSALDTALDSPAFDAASTDVNDSPSEVLTDAETDAADSSLEATTFASVYVNAICANVGACCPGDGMTYDAAYCAKRVTSLLDPSWTSVSTTTVFQPKFASRCLDLRTRETAKCGVGTLFRRAGIDDRLNLDCRAVFANSTASLGASCVGRECPPSSTDPNFCSDSATGPICVTDHDGMLGDSCGYAGHTTTGCRRADNLFCDPSARCSNLLKVGSKCRDGFDCSDGTFCGFTGTCELQAPLGAACTPETVALESCVPGAFCSATSKVCEALKPDGATCTGPSECNSFACRAGVCVNWYGFLCNASEPGP